MIIINISNKPAKMAKLQYTPEQISQLKSQMGISSMAQSINTLTGLMQTLVNANKDSPKGSCEVLPSLGVRRPSVVRRPSSVVRRPSSVR
jgi:prefoldin subunit 5